MRGLPVVMVYGNCQAEILARLGHFSMAEANRCRFVYIRSFLHPVEGKAVPREEDLAACAALWCQHDEHTPFAWFDRLPKRTRIIRFPGLDFNSLWPFHAAAMEGTPEPPRLPYGRGPYGDRILKKVRDLGLRGREGLAKYHELSLPALSNLGRLLEIERVRLARRDEACDIPVEPVIRNLFAGERLFWTVNQPSDLLLHGLADGLLQRTFGAGLSPSLQTGNYFADLHVPIHPETARVFGLKWWTPDLLYRWHGDRWMTHDDYIVEHLAGFPYLGLKER